ncbi:nicotinamide mononucleotide transporter [Pseudomonas duriflava]|uniref:Nicotinamide riboside transporter PnuC n=1 Tax=Pseudomonas duriflava TaxID=459528 RepID=A0A562Q7W2_9PSED|nr:nicotinamide riboside transporter PnuC [Pseudomonas duriflava]TWI52784.1 nicotinamide mononucleotide transporter [Pseudomonas duriflava]
MSSFEIVAALLGVIAVWLTVRQNVWCWPIGLIMVVMYSWVFYEAKLYSDMLLQGVYAVLQGYGWWQWIRGGADHRGRSVSTLQPIPLLTGLLAGVAGSLLLGYVMATYTDASQPWLDASLTAFSLVAQLWMAQKRVECWPLWLVVDVLYVGLFVYKSLFLTALLYALFVGLAARGWYAWRREVVSS